MTTIDELKMQKAAIEAQIAEAEAAARSGEMVIIDGKEYDSTADFEGMLADPADTDFFPTYRKDAEGDIAETGEITYAELVARFAQEATKILNQAISAGNTAVGNIQSAESSALSAIGQSDSAGARGSAITAIANALASALAAIGQTDNEGARKSALDAISTARTNALAAIGESDTTGARGNAITSINALYSAISEAITSANDAWDA